MWLLKGGFQVGAGVWQDRVERRKNRRLALGPELTDSVDSVYTQTLLLVSARSSESR